MISPEQTRRLAFIKYLVTIGNQQVKQPEPLASAALLTFHDAVELFLQLTSEHVNAGSSQPNFMDYWGLINPKLVPDELPQRESMRRMNKARVALKHHGTLPSRFDLEDFNASVNRFFEQSTPLVFGVSLDSVSLVDFVACDEAKASLQQATAALEAGDLRKGIEACAEAFDDLISDYEKRKQGRFGQSPFFFGESLSFLSSSDMGIHWSSAKDRKERSLVSL